jgi:hypothetical protein
MAMATRARLESRLKALEHALTPQAVTHVFVFLGWQGEGPAEGPIIRQNGRRPGEEFILIGFEPWSDGPKPRP